jgi:putative membrane protein
MYAAIAMVSERIPLDRKIMILWCLPTAAILLFAFIAGMAYYLITPDELAFGIARGNFVFLLLAMVFTIGIVEYVWLELEYRNFTYEMDEHEIMIRHGVITRRNTGIPYAAIREVKSVRNLLERILGLATVKIETSGTSNVATEIYLPGIPNKGELVQQIMEMVTKTKGAMGVEAREQGMDAAQLLTDILKELKSISAALVKKATKD